MIRVTDALRMDWHPHYIGMNFFSKIVATLLFVVLGAAPALGAIPCHEQAKPRKCCAVGCSMAPAANSSAQPRNESGGLTQCGCQVSPDRPALVSLVPAQRDSRDVALVDNTLASFAPIAIYPATGDYTPPAPELCRHSRSVLCIFQI